mgnify:CR=1 FL=1
MIVTMKKLATLLSILLMIAGCSREKADLVVLNATIYTVDSLFSVQESLDRKSVV